MAQLSTKTASQVSLTQEEYKALSRKANRTLTESAKTVVTPFRQPPTVSSGFDDVLSETQILSIIGKSKTDTIVLHRPIGQNSLDVDDWVASSAAELEQLMERKLDSLEMGLVTIVGRCARQIITNPPFGFEIKEGALKYPTGFDRKETLDRALKTSKAFWNALYPVEDYVSRRGEKKKPPRPKMEARFALLAISSNELNFELTYQALLKSDVIREHIATASPKTKYSTCKGTITMVEQASIPFLKGLSKERVVSELMAIASGQKVMNPDIPPIGAPKLYPYNANIEREKWLTNVIQTKDSLDALKLEDLDKEKLYQEINKYRNDERNNLIKLKTEFNFGTEPVAMTDMVYIKPDPLAAATPGS